MLRIKDLVTKIHIIIILSLSVFTLLSCNSVFVDNNDSFQESETQTVISNINKKGSVNSNGEEALSNAVREGSLSQVKLLLEQGVSPLASSSNPEYLLHIAAGMGNTDICKILLEYKVPANIKDSWGSTPLHKSADHDFYKATELLLKNGAIANERDDDGRTPLHLTSNPQIVEILLDYGADILATDDKGDTPALYHIKTNGTIDRAVLDIMTMPEKSSNADRLSQKKFNRYLSNMQSVLLTAAEINKVVALASVIDLGVDINFQDKDGFSALHIASMEGNKDAAEYLLKNGSNVLLKSDTGRTALHMAAAYDRSDLISILVNHGATVNINDSFGDTPTDLALSSNNIQIVKELIGYGAEPIWENSSSTAKISDFEKYLKLFPGGTQKAESVWWKNNSSTAEISDLRKYLELFPGGRYEQDAYKLLEKKMWIRAEDTRVRVDLYIDYLKSFPEGPHNKEARDCVDWSVSERKGPNGVKSYLARNPKGRFSETAEKIIASVNPVTPDQKEKINDAAFSHIKTYLEKSSPGWERHKSSTWGMLSSGDTRLAYSGAISPVKNSKYWMNAQLSLINGSTIEYFFDVFEYYDDEWYPAFNRFFEKSEKSEFSR